MRTMVTRIGLSTVVAITVFAGLAIDATGGVDRPRPRDAGGGFKLVGTRIAVYGREAG